MGTTTQASKFGSEYFSRNSVKNAFRPIGYIYEGLEHEGPTHRWRSVIERYAYSQFAIYIRLLERPLGNSRKKCFSEHHILLYRPRFAAYPFPRARDIMLERWKLEIKRLKQGSRKMDGAMLVNIREFLQMPKGTRVSLPCSAVYLGKRLLRLDNGNGIRTDTSQKLVKPVVSKPRLVLKNGKLVFLGLGFSKPIEESKLPNHMIQGGSEIVNDFPDFNSPHRIGRFLNVSTDNQLIRLSVELDSRNIGVSIQEPANFFLQGFDLIPCSPELQADAV